MGSQDGPKASTDDIRSRTYRYSGSILASASLPAEGGHLHTDLAFLLHPALQVRGLNLSCLHVGVALELIWGVTICLPRDPSGKTSAASGCVGRIARDHWRVKFYLKSFRMGMSGAESEPSPLREQEEQQVGKRRQEAWAVAIKCTDMFTTELYWSLEAWSRRVLFPLTDPSRVEHSPTRSAQQGSFATSLGCPSQCL